MIDVAARVRIVLGVATIAALAVCTPPASATVAFIKSSTVWVAEDNGTNRTQYPTAMGQDVELSHNGARFAVLHHSTGNVKVVNVASGATKTLNLAGDVNSISWAGNSKLYLTTSTKKWAQVWRWTSGQPKLVYREKRTCAEPGCWFPSVAVEGSPDGKLVAVHSSQRWGVSLIRANGTVVFHKKASAQLQQWQAIEVAWAADSSKFAQIEMRNYADGERVATVSKTGSRAVRKTTTTMHYNGLAWAPDGTAFAYGEYMDDDNVYSVYKYTLATHAVSDLVPDVGLANNTRLLGAWPDATHVIVGYANRINNVDLDLANDAVVGFSSGDWDWAA